MSEPGFWTIEEYLDKEEISRVELKKRIAMGLIPIGAWTSQLPVSINCSFCNINISENSEDNFTIYSASSFCTLYGVIKLAPIEWLKALEQGKTELATNYKVLTHNLSDLNDFSEVGGTPSPRFKSPYSEWEISNLMNKCFGSYYLWDSETEESLKITKAIFKHCNVNYPDRKKSTDDQMLEILTSLQETLSKFKANLDDVLQHNSSNKNIRDIEKVKIAFMAIIRFFKKNVHPPAPLFHIHVVPTVVKVGNILDIARQHFPGELLESLNHYWPKNRGPGLSDINFLHDLWRPQKEYVIKDIDLVVLNPNRNNTKEVESKLDKSLEYQEQEDIRVISEKAHTSELLEAMEHAKRELWEGASTPPKSDVVIAWLAQKYPEFGVNDKNHIDAILRPNVLKGKRR